ncbi:MAG: peroxidase-related enzyme [Acidimicrobiia bacterium]|nr:peroxidase-related enzyme [Acidimicrobiia bacterium]MYF83027.1 peroxidase-related enzyme [Acidimicrobiia bacterium]
MVHHRRGLRRLIKDDELVEAIERDWTTADLSRERRSMLRFAVKLTKTPGAMDEADVEDLRSAGFSDRDILDIVEVVGYYAYANRVADGLGIETESWIPD